MVFNLMPANDKVLQKKLNNYYIHEGVRHKCQTNRVFDFMVTIIDFVDLTLVKNELNCNVIFVQIRVCMGEMIFIISCYLDMLHWIKIIFSRIEMFSLGYFKTGAILLVCIVFSLVMESILLLDHQSFGCKINQVVLNGLTHLSIFFVFFD